MKSTLICTIVAASACALLISSAEAGGRKGGLGMSSSAMSTGASSPTSYGRSSLGEPVFLIPLPATNGGPIGGYVPPRTPLPPLTAPPSIGATASLGSSSGQGVVKNSREAGQQISIARESGSVSAVTTGTGRGTNVIFTPPPTIVGVPASFTGSGNISGSNLAADLPAAEGKFSGSILDTGLKSRASSTSSGLSQISASQSPSVVTVGSGPHASTGPASVIPSAPSGPTVQLGTTSSPASTSSSAATGH